MNIVEKENNIKTIMHKTIKDDRKNLGESEVIEDTKCPECGGILITNYGPGISCTFCVDCNYNEYDYD